MKKILLILFLFTPAFAKAQTNETAPKDTAEKFTPVEVTPSFPGGLEQLYMYIAKSERANGNEGKVRVSFVIEKDGSISEIKIEQSLSDSADKEAIRLISKMPKWDPAMQIGQPVRVKFTLPIKFPAS